MARLDFNKMAEQVAEAAFDIEYCGKTLREWVNIIANARPCTPEEDAISRMAVLDLLRTNWADYDGDTAMALSIDGVRELPAIAPCRDPIKKDNPVFQIFKEMGEIGKREENG